MVSSTAITSMDHTSASKAEILASTAACSEGVMLPSTRVVTAVGGYDGSLIADIQLFTVLGGAGVCLRPKRCLSLPLSMEGRALLSLILPFELWRCHRSWQPLVAISSSLVAQGHFLCDKHSSIMHIFADVESRHSPALAGPRIRIPCPSYPQDGVVLTPAAGPLENEV